MPQSHYSLVETTETDRIKSYELEHTTWVAAKRLHYWRQSDHQYGGSLIMN